MIKEIEEKLKGGGESFEKGKKTPAGKMTSSISIWRRAATDRVIHVELPD